MSTNLRGICFVLLLAASLSHGLFAQQRKAEDAVREQFVGAWRLVSIETIRANGEVIYPFYGRHPQGLIMYDKSGWMSVQIASDPRPTVPKADSREEFLAAPASEKAAAADGYYAYCGTWTVDVAKSAVTHHIRESLFPAEWGEAGVRHFVFEKDHLILTAKTHEMGEDHERRLIWQRTKAEQQ